MMRRTGIRRPTYEEAIAKKKAAEERRRANPKPKKEKTYEEKLKTKLWTIFSVWIRRKDANVHGYVMTADGSWKHWKEVHCGHLFNNTERNAKLGGNELWYDERNFAPQTSNGNYFNHDDSAKKYMAWAIRKYGDDVVQEMFRLKQRKRVFTIEELEEKLRYYKEKVKALDA